MIIVNPNINQTSIQVRNTLQFPSVPSKWTDRFDVRIWNEMESICTDALEQITSHKKKAQCTIILVGIWTTMFILANILLGVWAGSISDYDSDSDSDSYCCDYDYYYDYCNSYCYYDDYDDDGVGAFIASMVFYGLSGCICFFICPFVIYYDCFYQKNKTSSNSTPGSNLSPNDELQNHFNSLNEKYQNMIIFKIISVHIPSSGCQCCASNDHQSNTTYFELEIEMKVQQITYIADSLPSSLPTQHQIQTAGSVPMQQPIQIVNSLPTQQQMQQQSSLGYVSNIGGNNGFRQKHYTQWNTNDVLNWMVQLDNGQFTVYQQRLAETLNVEQIDGNDLVDLDKDDVHRLGVLNFKLKKSLLQHIQSLSQVSQLQPVAVYQDVKPIAPSAPGNFNEINIDANVNEGAITHR